jgi:hypothetical protein
MHCEACHAIVEPFWRWCPECGGRVTADSPNPDPYAVEWATEAERREGIAAA